MKMPDESSDPDIERKLEQWAGSGSGTGISSELQHRLLSLLTPSLKSVKPIPGQSAIVARFLSVFAALAAVMVALIDKAGFHLMTVAQIGWMGSILAGGAVLYSFALAGQMVPGEQQGLSFSVVLALSSLGVIAGISLNFPWMASRRFVSEGWPCALTELTTSVPAALLFWSLARRGALFSSAKLGASLAGLAVFTVLIPLQSQCMFLQAPHLLTWHVGTAALLIGLGAWIGSRLRRAWRL